MHNNVKITSGMRGGFIEPRLSESGDCQFKEKSCQKLIVISHNLVVIVNADCTI